MIKKVKKFKKIKKSIFIYYIVRECLVIFFKVDWLTLLCNIKKEKEIKILFILLFNSAYQKHRVLDYETLINWWVGLTSKLAWI